MRDLLPNQPYQKESDLESWMSWHSVVLTLTSSKSKNFLRIPSGLDHTFANRWENGDITIWENTFLLWIFILFSPLHSFSCSTNFVLMHKNSTNFINYLIFFSLLVSRNPDFPQKLFFVDVILTTSSKSLSPHFFYQNPFFPKKKEQNPTQLVVFLLSKLFTCDDINRWTFHTFNHLARK